jgi:hypothetical protein
LCVSSASGLRKQPQGSEALRNWSECEVLAEHKDLNIVFALHIKLRIMQQDASIYLQSYAVNSP